MNKPKPEIRIIITHADGGVTELAPAELADYQLKAGDKITILDGAGENAGVVEVLQETGDLIVVLDDGTTLEVSGFFSVEDAAFYPLGMSGDETVQASDALPDANSATIWQASGPVVEDFLGGKLDGIANLSPAALGVLGGAV